MEMPTLISFFDKDAGRVFESKWHKCFDDYMYAWDKKVITEVKPVARGKGKQMKIRWKVVRKVIFRRGGEVLELEDCLTFKDKDSALEFARGEVEFADFLAEENKLFDGRYFWDFEIEDGKIRPTRRFMCKFEGRWI